MRRAQLRIERVAPDTQAFAELVATDKIERSLTRRKHDPV